MSEYSAEICEEFYVHTDAVLRSNREMPDEEELCSLAELFKVFGDSTRIKILYALSKEELCVCDLAELLDYTQPAMSYQLKILRQAKLIKNRREGKSILYSLADEHVKTIIGMAREHIEE